MALVFTTLSASVDGYVSGREARPGRGLGDGFRIFDWLSDEGSPNRAVATYHGHRTGAVNRDVTHLTYRVLHRPSTG